jgi:hypothetical protein
VSHQNAGPEEQPLTDFITKHEKIITVIGIFGALTAFFASLKNGAILVIFSYLLFFLLCLELLTHFPNYKEYFSSGLKSIRLFTFEVLTCILILVLFCYVVYYQPVILGLTVIISLFVSLFYLDQISIPVNTYLDIHRKTGRVVRTLVAIGILGLLMFFAILIIALIFGVLNYFGIITLPSVT